jgi:hypothetical protein
MRQRVRLWQRGRPDPQETGKLVDPLQLLGDMLAEARTDAEALGTQAAAAQSATRPVRTPSAGYSREALQKLLLQRRQLDIGAQLNAHGFVSAIRAVRRAVSPPVPTEDDSDDVGGSVSVDSVSSMDSAQEMARWRAGIDLLTEEPEEPPVHVDPAACARDAFLRDFMLERQSHNTKALLADAQAVLAQSTLPDFISAQEDIPPAPAPTERQPPAVREGDAAARLRALRDHSRRLVDLAAQMVP